VCGDGALSPLAAVEIVFAAMTPCGDSVDAHCCWLVRVLAAGEL
jgi:hypothetical protein